MSEALKERPDRVIARITSDTNVADMFTKMLAKVKFAMFRNNLGTAKKKIYEDANSFEKSSAYTTASRATLRSSSHLIAQGSRALVEMIELLPLKDELIDCAGKGESRYM